MDTKDEPEEETKMEAEAEIKVFLEKMFEVYEIKDLDKVMDMYTPDPDLIVYGTGKDEKCIGLDEIKDQLKRDFAQSESLRFSSKWVKVSSEGNIAWFASDVMIKAKVGGQKFTLPARITGVLKKHKGNWRIVQEHYSLPAAGQTEGNSFPEG